MAEIVVVLDLPIGSASDVDATELALLLRDVKAAQIVDFIDANELQKTMSQPADTPQEYAESEYERY